MRASTWLYLTSVFGYVQAAIVLGETIHPADLIGLVLVLGGLVGGRHGGSALVATPARDDLTTQRAGQGARS